MAESKSTELNPLVILDDGIFYVELNTNYDPATAPGFLQRSCQVGLTRPGGFDCVGSFDRNHLGTWNASINAAPDEDFGSDSTLLCSSDLRVAAIVELWRNRTNAF